MCYLSLYAIVATKIALSISPGIKRLLSATALISGMCILTAKPMLPNKSIIKTATIAIFANSKNYSWRCVFDHQANKTAPIQYPRRYPPVGPIKTAIPPRSPVKMGSPINANNKNTPVVKNASNGDNNNPINRIPMF